MIYLVLGLIIIVSLILQNAILPYMTIFGVMGNLSLGVVISIALLGKKPYASISGLILGLLQDILFSSIVGINALIYFIIGYILERADLHISRDNIYMAMAFTAAFTLAYNLLYFILMYFAAKNVSLVHFLMYKLLIEVIYNSLLAIPSYVFISKIFVAPAIRFYRE